MGGAFITNDVLKFKKVIEFESLCIAICFWQDQKSKKVVKIYKINERSKFWAGVPIAVSSSKMYSPVLVSSSWKKNKGKDKEN